VPTPRRSLSMNGQCDGRGGRCCVREDQQRDNSIGPAFEHCCLDAAKGAVSNEPLGSDRYQAEGAAMLRTRARASSRAT
jgi:hypothetical protein